jgi:RNA polymerase sigma-70 factor, ECF subfamily
MKVKSAPTVSESRGSHADVGGPPSSEELSRLLGCTRARGLALMRRLGIPQKDHEDLLQEALIAVFTRWSDVRTPESFLLAALRNHARNYLRGRKIEISLDDAAEEIQSPRHSWLGEARDVERQLAALPERWRRALLLRRVFGFGVGEVADQLGASQRQVYLWTSRAACRLRAGVLSGAKPPPES